MKLELGGDNIEGEDWGNEAGSTSKDRDRIFEVDVADEPLR